MIGGKGGQDAHLKLVFEILAYEMLEVDVSDYFLLVTANILDITPLKHICQHKYLHLLWNC